MSNIKNLFGSKKNNKLIVNSSLSDIGKGIESADYVKSRSEQIQRVVPSVNYSSASNFAFYGLAEKYFDPIRAVSADGPSGLGMTSELPNSVRTQFGPSALHGRAKTPPAP